MKPLSLEEVLENIHQLPSLSTVVTELIQSIHNDDLNVDDLAHGIAKDQALSARALRVANSPFYGMTQRVTTIHDAIVVLGFRAVGSLVTAASVTGYFTPQSHQDQVDFLGFWRHSIGVAVAGRELAARGGVDAESGFTAGLLHDIGKLLLAANHPKHYAEVIAFQHAHDCLGVEAERQVLGFDHAQAGAALAERWKFPPSICQAVAYHHAPVGQPDSRMAGVVHVADIVAHALDLADDPSAQVPPLDGAAWRRLDLDVPAFKAVLGEVATQHDAYCALLA